VHLVGFIIRICQKNVFDKLDFLEEDSSNCKVFTDTWRILSSLILVFLYCTTSAVTSFWRHQGHMFDFRPSSMNSFVFEFLSFFCKMLGCLTHSTFSLFYSLLTPSVTTISAGRYTVMFCIGCAQIQYVFTAFAFSTKLYINFFFTISPCTLEYIHFIITNLCTYMFV